MHAELFLWPDTACRPACAVRGWSSNEKRKAGGGGEGDEPGRRWRAGAVQGVFAGLRDPARHLRLASRHRDRFSERHSVHHRLWLRLERPAAARAQPPTDARVLSRRSGGGSGGAGGQVAPPLKDVGGQTCLFATPSEASGKVKNSTISWPNT